MAAANDSTYHAVGIMAKCKPSDSLSELIQNRVFYSRTKRVAGCTPVI